MAFTIANWLPVNVSLNAPQETITPYGGSPTVLNGPNLYMYGSPNDTAAEIGASNYFLSQYASLGVGDWIMGFGTDTSFIYQVTAVSSTSVTTESVGFSSSVGTANIINNAVTYAKIQQASAGDVLLANPTGSAANYEEVTLGNALSFTGTTLGVPLNVLRLATFSLTAAQFKGMYATPVSVLAAPGANLMNIVDSCAINYTYSTAAYAAGGAVGLQYGNTADLAGPPASTTEAATDYTSATANTMFRFGGGLSTGAVTSTAINTAIYISNASAAFTTGSGTFAGYIWYKTVAAA
jgi:hypothetical protein